MNVADEVQILNVDVTEIAHDKDINSVSVSPNDKFIATGSQDKTAKVSFVPIVTDFMEHSSLEKLSYSADQLLSVGSLTRSQKPPLLYPA
jgi:WD40 repeat protein